MILAWLLARQGVVHAHKAPIPLAIWGIDLDAAEAACQRAISRGIERCGQDVWRARSTCVLAQLNGESCDTSGVADEISQAHASAITFAERACDGVDLAPLGFSLLDIDLDIDSFCLQLHDATVSNVFGIVLDGEAVRVVDEHTRQCVVATARATTRLLSVAFRLRRRTFDRIASKQVHPLSPAQKLRLVDQSTARIGTVRAALENQIATECPDFATVYQRSVTAVLTSIAQRGDCLSGSAYTQDAVLCPQPVCGNGVLEPLEQCDDGNLIDGDGCRHGCMLETVP